MPSDLCELTASVDNHFFFGHKTKCLDPTLAVLDAKGSTETFFLASRTRQQQFLR